MIIKRNLTSFTRVLYSTATKSGGQSGSGLFTFFCYPFQT